MSLEKLVNDQLKAAMLARDEVRLRGLRAIKAAVLIANTSEGAADSLKEEDEIKLLQKLIKQRKDSLEIFEKQNRPDLAKKEKEEIGVIEGFFNAQLSEADLRTILEKIIIETGAGSASDLGKVMATATKQLGGKADGKTIAAVARELLSK
jgi:uncharacterized protein YqeY